MDDHDGQGGEWGVVVAVVGGVILVLLLVAAVGLGLFFMVGAAPEEQRMGPAQWDSAPAPDRGKPQIEEREAPGGPDEKKGP